VIIAHFARFDIPDTGHGIYRSLDDGETWEPVITGTGRNTFLFSSDTHGTIYFAGNPRGDGQDKVWKPIYRSTDNGATFEKTVDSVRIWAFTPAADGKMYIYAPIDSTGLTVRSSDRGATWEQLPLPAIRGDYNSLFTEGADGMLYWSTAHYSDPYYPPATVVRLHRSVDGRNWEPFDEGLPRVGITGFLDMPGRPLFVATERGIYRMDRRSAAPLPVAEHGFAFDITPNPLDDHGDIIIDLASREHLRVTLHDMLGRTISTLADDEREAGRSTIVIATEELAAGSYIIRASVGGRTASRVVIVR
jgi:hypothetical protein